MGTEVPFPKLFWGKKKGGTVGRKEFAKEGNPL